MDNYPRKVVRNMSNEPKYMNSVLFSPVEKNIPEYVSIENSTLVFKTEKHDAIVAGEIGINHYHRKQILTLQNVKVYPYNGHLSKIYSVEIAMEKSWSRVRERLNCDEQKQLFLSQYQNIPLCEGQTITIKFRRTIYIGQMTVIQFCTDEKTEIDDLCGLVMETTIVAIKNQDNVSSGDNESGGMQSQMNVELVEDKLKDLKIKCMQDIYCIYYDSLASRLGSYINWPKYTSGQIPEDLSLAGFYYTGLSDITQCYRCGGMLRDWQKDDNVIRLHSAWYPHCGDLTLLSSSTNSLNIVTPMEENSFIYSCKLCSQNRVQIIFMPCFHIVTCAECAQRYSKCCICREDIKAIMEVFIS